MADFNLPVTDSDYVDYADEVKGPIASVAKGFDGTTDTNVPAGAIGWDSANSRWKRYVSGAWQALCSLYEITVRRAITADSADSVDGANVAGTVGSATNAENLGGVAAAQYVRTTDSRMTDSRQCNNSFDSASTARTNMSVYSQAEINSALALKSNISSPTFTGTPAAPTAAAGTNTTQLATTAFAMGIRFYYGSPIDLSPYIQTLWTDNGSFAVPIYQGGDVVGAEIHIRAISSSGSGVVMYRIPSGILATLCSNLGYTSTSVCMCGLSAGIVTISQQSSMNIAYNGSAGTSTVYAFIKVLAKSLL